MISTEIRVFFWNTCICEKEEKEEEECAGLFRI